MKDKKVLMEMIRIFGYPKKDWMGYKITKRNYISYHHILEKRDGGIESVENGAILTKDSHLLLNKLEFYNYDLYLEWQCLFLDINASKMPLNDYFTGRIGALKKETKDFFISLKDEYNDSFTL